LFGGVLSSNIFYIYSYFIAIFYSEANYNIYATFIWSILNFFWISYIYLYFSAYFTIFCSIIVYLTLRFKQIFISFNYQKLSSKGILSLIKEHNTLTVTTHKYNQFFKYLNCLFYLQSIILIDLFIYLCYFGNFSATIRFIFILVSILNITKSYFYSFIPIYLSFEVFIFINISNHIQL